MQVNPYLTFNGQCEEAFTFYAQCLGGKIESMMHHAGSPAEAQTPPDWLDKILHARLNVGGSILMGSDAPPGNYQSTQGSFAHLAVEDPDEAERVFHAFAEGGRVIMPIGQTFWAKRFGMLVDRFGIPWMVNC
jgi:PhnB protein